jgi:hypothetical protein
MIKTIARQYGVHYTDDEVAALSFEEKSNRQRNPVTAARHFQYAFCQDHLLSSLVDYPIRIEFQARGYPYAHFVVWIEDTPQFGEHHNSIVCCPLE